MPTNENDAEISDMLAQLHGSPSQDAAHNALNRFRTEALAGARDGADRTSKEKLVNEARQRLKETLRTLLK
jgi:hypothetical protein